MIDLIKPPLIASAVLALAFAPFDAFAKKKFPDESFDGLIRVEKAKADAVYFLPDADLSGYRKFILIEPEIAFRSGWQSDTNSNRRTDRVSNSDMESMINKGKDLFLDEFTKTLEKKGYPVVHTAEGDVLRVEASIIDLDVFAPDPNNNAAWSKVYSKGSGKATLVLELYDSVSGQLLVRAIDTKTDEHDSFSWRIPRTQSSNINDARKALGSWAKMLAKGLENAIKAKN